MNTIYCKSLYFRGAVFPRKAQVQLIRGGLILAQLRPLNLVFSWAEIINPDF